MVDTYLYYIKVSGIASGNKSIKLTCEDMISSHVKISMISLISSLSLKLYLNSLVYPRNIFPRKPSAICSVRTVTTSGQYYPVRSSRSVSKDSKRLVFLSILLTQFLG